jgi:glycosyltransferase involved in cell wall biosynthesis
MVALENRFLRTTNGNIYSTTGCDYTFWCRYLQVFDEVVVFARVAEVPETELDRPAANGPNVRFFPLPIFIGPWQFLRHYWQLKRLSEQAITEADAFILRAPGTMATLLWCHLKKRGIPYGIEVLGDPLDSLKRGSVRSIFRPVARWRLYQELIQQCKFACAASYVTKFTLQKRYPPSSWSTHYSSIRLPDEAIIEEKDLAPHLASIRDAISGKRALRICHMGTMSALYKGQDVLLEAVHLCRKSGRNIELTLLGEGQYERYFINKAEELGLTEYVIFLGQLPPGKAVIEQLDAADLFILPSYAEGLPRGLIEAMARGLPCLASAVGGIPELLDDEYLFSPKDPVAIAKAIESLFTDKTKFEMMARHNLQTAKKYRTDVLNKRRVEFYRKVAEETRLANDKRCKSGG